MTWLVTGAAGYIGSHVVQALRRSGTQVVALDNLCSGDRSRLPAEVPFVHASVLDRMRLQQVLREHEIVGVVHLASKKAVEESIRVPLDYYRTNTQGVLELLEAMVATGVRRLVFSSSAAVYGIPGAGPIGEPSPTVPLSPYGRSKLIGEWMVSDLVSAGALDAVSLRYFNVVGCAEPALADTGGTNLFPRVIAALASGRPPVILGSDYPTPDGTCVRDYTHVVDLADAHAAAIALTVLRPEGGTRHHILNVGCGRGHSVLDVLKAFATASGLKIAPVFTPRRACDPPFVVADATLARRLLSWTPRHDLSDMVSTSWAARRHPATAG